MKLGALAAGATPFAEGGIVSQPTIGLLGEAGPEAVIPLDRAGGGGGGTEQTIIIELDGRRIGESVIKELPSLIRVRTGAFNSF